MDSLEIRARLPHRYPFLLVDAVTELEPGKSCVAEKPISWNEACYSDIPDSPDRRDFRYPVHLIIESFAQAGALLCLVGRETLDVKEEYVMLAGSVRGMDIAADAFPGDVLVHEVRIDREFSDTVVLTGAVRKRKPGGAGMETVATIENVVIALRPKSDLAAAGVPEAAHA